MKNLILKEFIDTGPLLVFGRRDVQAEAKGDLLHTDIAGGMEDKAK
jgi:hypothetical protein